MHEVETKILEVNPLHIKERISSLGAKLMLDDFVTVDWFRTPGTKEGEDPWFLRVRSFKNGKTEVTWKGKSRKLGVSRKHKEINIDVGDHKSMMNLFISIGLEHYAHQEKHRTSWKYKNWSFDLDTYPNMPPYLEIEGVDEKHINEIIKKLRLEQNESSNEGERVLIQEKYNLNWYNMRF